MLKRIEIAGFRSCQVVGLDNLESLTVLVGRNAAGKSNILRAISWLANSATSSTALSLSETGFGTTAIDAQAVLGDDTYYYHLRVSVELSRESNVDIQIVEELHIQPNSGQKQLVFDRQGAVIRLGDGTTVGVSANVPCMPAIVSVLAPDSRHVGLVRPFLDYLKAIGYYPLFQESDTDIQTPLVRQSEYNDWLARHGGSSALGIAVLMRLLDMSLTRKEDLEELQHLLGPDGLGIIHRIKVQTIRAGGDQKQEDNWYFITFQERPALPRAVSFGDLSSGTQRLIAIAASLIHDRSAVMLLEHPEDGIHRGLLRKLIGLLEAYSDRSQLIISSHSAVVFNTVPPSAIRLVTMENGGTKARSLTPGEADAVAQYLEEEGTPVKPK